MEKLPQFITETPNNNFSHLHRASGREALSESLGGNCIYQARKLGDLLEDQGYTHLRFARESDTHHVSLMAKLDGEDFLFDRSMQHLRPLRVENAFKPDGEVCDAYPIVHGRMSLVSLVANAQGLRLEKLLPIAESGFMMTNSYQLEYAQDEAPELDFVSSALKTRELIYLTAVGQQGEERRLVYRAQNRDFYLKRIGGELPDGKVQRKVSESKPEFAHELGDMSEAMGTDLWVAMEKMREAAEISRILRHNLRVGLTEGYARGDK